MTLTLHLGVVDIPYADSSYEAPPKKMRLGGAKRGKAEAPPTKKGGGAKTTGDVAEILEDKYHVIEFFYEDLGGELIAGALENSVLGAIESVVLGAPVDSIRPTAEAEGEIEAAFRHFLDQREMDGHAPGVPTAASVAGVNHRFLHPYAKSNKSRPSFIDTGLYQANFKAWVD